MEVRIGTTIDGEHVWFDTTTGRALLLVGDAGRGKTTIARYLTRWWLADTCRHAHVYTNAPSEWSDLCSSTQRLDDLDQHLNHNPEHHPEHHPDHHLDQHSDHDCPSPRCLVVVDDADQLDQRHLLSLMRRHKTILTAHTGSDLIGYPLLEDDLDCVGLVRGDDADPVEAAVLNGQGRFDWPSGTIAVVADRRGSTDLPRHRWQAPVGIPTAVTR